MMRISLLTLLIAFISACQNDRTGDMKHPSSLRLDTLFNTYWEEHLQLFPLEATAIGDNRYNDRLPVTISASYREKLRQFYSRYLSEIKEIATTNDEEALSKDLFEYEMKNCLEGLKYPSHLMPINQFWSFTLEFPQLGSGSGNQPFKTVADYDNFLSRMKQFPAWVDTAIQNMQEGIKSGYVLPKTLCRKVIPQCRQVIAGNITNSLFYAPVKNMPSTFSKAEKDRLQQAYIEQIRTSINPTYEKLARFFETEYLPVCRESCGWSALPNGKEYYQYLIRKFTTTNLTPDSIYQTGLSEVARIRGEMEKVKDAVGFKGSLQDFFNFMNKDAQFFPFRTAEAVLDSFRAIQKTEDLHLKELFERSPKTRFEIRQTEAYRAASASAEYNAGSEDGSRPGIFYVPILDPRKFNTIGMETLFLHEAIPGHHYQISLQQENNTLPKFRKFLDYSAYAEGWALYTETLGKDLGLFVNPYQYFGHLSDAMHRAIRLVLDVSLHTKKMSREDAIAYMRANERISEEEATSEIERYMAIPGQALSYKTGQMTITKLREKYQRELGPKFNLPAFHSCILDGGNMPLEILEKKLARWAKTY